jgi:DNA-damage-inducible protein D
MKARVKAEDGLELSTICRQLKLKSSDGEMRFKQWLAKVGYERIQDMADPALSVDRTREYL